MLLFFFFCLVYVVEFGVHLAELTVDPQGALAIRQVSTAQSPHACHNSSDVIDDDLLMRCPDCDYSWHQLS